MATRFATGLPDSRDLQLQVCGACNKVNYPRRELCGACLADKLSWQPVDAGGEVLSLTELHYSLEHDYAESLPWQVASVQLNCGPVAIAHLQPGVSLHDSVVLKVVSDSHGNRMLVAVTARSGDINAWLHSIGFHEVSP